VKLVHLVGFITKKSDCKRNSNNYNNKARHLT